MIWGDLELQKDQRCQNVAKISRKHAQKKTMSRGVEHHKTGRPSLGNPAVALYCHKVTRSLLPCIAQRTSATCGCPKVRRLPYWRALCEAGPECRPKGVLSQLPGYHLPASVPGYATAATDACIAQQTVVPLVGKDWLSARL